MRNTLESLCAQIAQLAQDHDKTLLAHILRMAAMEAAQNAADLQPFTLPIRKISRTADQVVGMWDWDVTNNRNYLDARCAEYFNVDPDDAETGLPNEAYSAAIHPDDMKGVAHALDSAIFHGGVFVHEYRVIKDDRVRWLHGRGTVTLDKSGRPIRFPGVIVDITHEKLS